MYSGSGTTSKQYYLADERGSIVARTDASGTVLATAAYGPYGQGSDPGVTRFGYTGQMALSGTGLYHYKARAYAPALGRFLQADPIRFAGGLNLYAYTGGDPVNFSDPLGLVICTGTRIPRDSCNNIPGNTTSTVFGGGGGLSGGGGGGNPPPPCDSSNMCEEIVVIGSPLPPLVFFDVNDVFTIPGLFVGDPRSGTASDPGMSGMQAGEMGKKNFGDPTISVAKCMRSDGEAFEAPVVGIDSVLGVALIRVAQPAVVKRGGLGEGGRSGMTTSPASKALRSVTGKLRLPSRFGMLPTTSVGGLFGRALPFIGDAAIVIDAIALVKAPVCEIELRA